MILDVQIKLVAALMILLLFGFSGQYLFNLASADTPAVQMVKHTRYAKLTNTPTDTHGRDRNADIAAAKEIVAKKIMGCYDVTHPKICSITSGAKYKQYAP